jgi:hypothetical protein
MVRSKLTEQDQQAIVSQYRTSDVTTGALADSFGVSASTITRILKDGIPADDYRELVRSRRGGITRNPASSEQPEVSSHPVDPAATSRAESAAAQLSLMDPAAEDNRSSAKEEKQTEAEINGSQFGDPDQDGFEDDTDQDDPDEDDDEDFDEEDDDSLEDPDAQELQAELDDPSESAVPENDDFDPQSDDSQEEDEDLDLDDDDDEDPDEDDFEPDPTPALQVLPLEDLDYPPVCFAVIDRHQELTTRPLEDFTALDISALSNSELPEEVLRKAKTLPIFDSHRVARRFSDMCKRDGNAPHRIIQFQGQTLVVASTQLKRKGITHLLVDGQIFSI